MQGKGIRLLGTFAPATQTTIKHADLSPDSDSGRQYLTHLFTNKVTRSRPWTPSSSPQLPAGNSGLPHHPQPVSPPTGGGKRYRIMNLPPEDEEDACVSQLKGIS